MNCSKHPCFGRHRETVNAQTALTLFGKALFRSNKKKKVF
jgi:hypothetical protein